MADEASCGRGLAEYSPIAAKLADVISSVSENLEVHMAALDLDNERSREEYFAYSKLAHDHRRVASELSAIAEELARYRDLPMGEHEPAAMSSPRVLATFEELVKHERELLAMLEERVEEEQRMLVEAVVAQGSSSGAV